MVWQSSKALKVCSLGTVHNKLSGRWDIPRAEIILRNRSCRLNIDPKVSQLVLGGVFVRLSLIFERSEYS